MKWLCETPKITTYRVNLLNTNAEEVSAIIQDALLKKYSNPPKVFTTEQFPEIVCIENVNPDSKRIDFLSSGNENSLKEIIVDTKCASSILRGAHIYAQGVLAMPSGTKNGELIKIYGDYDKKCKKGTKTYYESPNKIYVGKGIVRQQRYELYGPNLTPSGIAVEMIETISGVPCVGYQFLTQDKALLQNFPSIVCCRVLDPKPFETVLDMCSAPGNKTTHLVELMNDTGTLIALDKVENRVKLVRQKIEQLAYKSVKCFAYDATNSVGTEMNQICRKSFEPPFPPNSFDKILLDAPCSAIGNRPNLHCALTLKMLESFPNVQKRLFSAAVKLLKPGGHLVYSTCTVTEAENEDIVKWALEKFSDIKLVEAAPTIGAAGLKNCGLTDVEREKLQRFGTESCRGFSVDSVGFFIAKFKKD